jgi:hypothetical protein
VNITRPLLSFTGIQIKSEETFHRFAASVQEIEQVAGIHEVRIELRNIFFCPWINMDNCQSTPMERLLIGLVKRLGTK